MMGRAVSLLVTGIVALYTAAVLLPIVVPYAAALAAIGIAARLAWFYTDRW